MAGKKLKVVDKWKSKKWYTVRAPSMFDGKELCEVVAADDKLLQNRIVRKSLMELGIGGSSQMAMFTTMLFRIKDVKGVDASTILIGHEISPSFIKTFARRGKSLIHEVVEDKTKDGETLRLKLISVTGARVSWNTKKNIRKIMVDETRKAITEGNFDEVIQDVLYGRFSAKLYNQLKTITKMRRVEVRKSERGEVFK
jgi:small subunit ribosomal protein S3Ae